MQESEPTFSSLLASNHKNAYVFIDGLWPDDKSLKYHHQNREKSQMNLNAVNFLI